VAAGVISLDVVKDGFTHIKRSMADLMDQRPTDAANGKPLRLEERIEEALCSRPEVLDARARLREEGHVTCGEVFVALADGVEVVPVLRDLESLATELDWRLYELVMTPVEIGSFND
jgi:divalent metal cation (Fe/Co/Zn/Cd) transporter